jgi:hypothetical protein
MNNFTPKYVKMASQYLQESIESLKLIEIKKEEKLLQVNENSSFLKKIILMFRGNTH